MWRRYNLGAVTVGMELETLSHQCGDLNYDFIINQAFINEGKQSRLDLQASSLVYNGM